MSEIYVIVANSTSVRVLHSTSKTLPLVEIQSLEHPEGRLHARELTADLPGHDTNRTGSGRHSLDSQTDPKHHELIEFAHDVAGFLENLVNQRHIDQLMLVAPPAFLGALRQQLPESVNKAITFELDKNLTQFKPEELRSYLPYFKPVESTIA